MTTTSSRPQSPEAYRTLENNLKKARFKAESSFRWLKNVEGVAVIVEFLCETGQVEPRKIFKPKEGTGSCFGAFNVRGAQLVTRDYVEREIEADRLDDGGHSKVIVRVANILSYTVLKILAFQDRHENKDSYDLIYCLLNFGEGPDDAGQAAAQSAIRRWRRRGGSKTSAGSGSRDAGVPGSDAISHAVVAAVDVRSLANVRWWRASGNDAGGGRDLDELVEALAADLNQHRSDALGFEAPIIVPLPAETVDLCRRVGERATPWSAGAGTGALALGVQQAGCACVRRLGPTCGSATTDQLRSLQRRLPDDILRSSRRRVLDRAASARIAESEPAARFRRAVERSALPNVLIV